MQVRQLLFCSLHEKLGGKNNLLAYLTVACCGVGLLGAVIDSLCNGLKNNNKLKVLSHGKGVGPKVVSIDPSY